MFCYQKNASASFARSPVSDIFQTIRRHNKKQHIYRLFCVLSVFIQNRLFNICTFDYFAGKVCFSQRNKPRSHKKTDFSDTTSSLPGGTVTELLIDSIVRYSTESLRDRPVEATKRPLILRPPPNQPKDFPGPHQDYGPETSMTDIYGVTPQGVNHRRSHPEISTRV